MNRALLILLVPIALALVLVTYSLLFGWNFVSALLFWFGIVPFIVLFYPFLIHKKPHLVNSLMGLIIFYALMVFRIYGHYETHLFKVMQWSFFVNLTILLLTFVGSKLRI